MTKPSPKLIRALLILRDQQPHSAAEFAELMWPSSIMHDMVSNQGNGATRGKAAWLCGGSYLGKLSQAGWIMLFKTFERRAGKPVAYLTQAAEDLLKVQSA